MEEQEGTVAIIFKAPAQMKADLDQAAKREDIDVSKFLRRLIRKELYESQTVVVNQTTTPTQA